MENYKVRVANEAESKEAQELFFELGGKLHEKTTDRFGLVVFVNGFVYVDRINFENYYTNTYSAKEITIPQLRDLVVLKRNDPKDATHTDGNHSFYVGKGKSYYFSSCDKAWCETWKNVDILKPIEKPMKEYLDPENGYKLNLTDRPFFDWIEIPEGAEVAYFFNGFDLKTFGDDICFYKDAIGLIYYDDNWHKIDDEKVKNFVLSKGILLWQRHTQPEELPFVDDEPSLNDQYAEIEQVRKEYKLKNDMSVDGYINSLRCEDTVNHPSHYASGAIECIDAIESSMTHEAFCGYLKGNVQKYMWRYENKGGLESLEKAQWYLNKLISRVG
jgi:hypothetical protein